MHKFALSECMFSFDFRKMQSKMKDPNGKPLLDCETKLAYVRDTLRYLQDHILVLEKFVSTLQLISMCVLFFALTEYSKFAFKKIKTPDLIMNAANTKVTEPNWPISMTE